MGRHLAHKNWCQLSISKGSVPEEVRKKTRGTQLGDGGMCDI